ncbi:putative polysaccharide biosynthesis protein [Alkaliphilus peptidifermentans]|uniref:Stage V sporulation protein B n=1 Tax=Alkaliphilus peptidifermentans DSM 18978 TaxID=1120976 RepID=A0A1G5I0D2_9FIRM|nr:polysaccharide biosynthesis protein [Alkaliphilus peptidifermentans]SCY69437.1 stage V sporulation protein B [Alkaliphilus peptidifermentans DSM 18978]
MSNKKFIKGAFILAIAGLTAKFLGMFFKIPLQRLIHDEGMGIFGLPYPIYTVLLTISIIGFPAAISKLISEKIAVGNTMAANKIFRVSFFMLLGIGLFTSLFFYLNANRIINLLNWPQETYYSIIGLSFAPFFVAIMSAFRGYFQGLQLMTPTAISQIVEQMGRVFIGVGLAYFYISKGTGYAAGAASFGATIGAFLGTIVLLGYYLKYKSRTPFTNIENKTKQDSTYTIIKKILWIAFPITIGAILSSVMGLIDSIIVHSSLIGSGYTAEGATILYGRLTGKAVTLMNVPLTLSMAMAASLVPAISESFSKRNFNELREKATVGIKITIMMALPAAIGLSLLSHEIIHLLWGKGEAGGDILRILAFNVLFISIAQTMTSILQGIGNVYIPVRNLVIGVIVKLIISHLLLSTYLNIIGTVIGTMAGYMVIMLLNYYELKRLIELRIEFKETIIKPIFATTTMALLVFIAFKLSLYYIKVESIATLISIVIGIAYYAILIYLIGGKYITKGKSLFYK